MRLIDADALLKAMEKERQFLLARGQTGAEHILVHHCLPLIDNAPSVPLPDFKEGYKQAIIDGKTNFSRPQGEWVNPQDCFCYQCSNCGEYTNNEGTVKEGLFDFCPKCGAKMKSKGGAV